MAHRFPGACSGVDYLEGNAGALAEPISGGALLEQLMDGRTRRVLVGTWAAD